MKRLLKGLGRAAVLALALMAAAILLPSVREWASGFLPQGKYQRASVLLTHEMEKVGELTAVRHTETGIMEVNTNAFLLGTVQQIKAPYTYEIGLGVRLEDVELTAAEDGIRVAVPQARLMYDSFQITGSAEINDFWNLFSQDRYQQMQDDQRAACRRQYLESGAYLEEAWDAACRQLEQLFSQWAEEKLPLQFVHAEKAE